jgi:hypothetical protein
VPISDVFFELVNERRKKCVEHGGANNPFRTYAPPAQTEDGESVSEAARSVYMIKVMTNPIEGIISILMKYFKNIMMVVR